MSLPAIYLLFASAVTQTPSPSQGQGLVASVAVIGRVEGSCTAGLHGIDLPMRCNVPSVRTASAAGGKASIVWTIRAAL